MARGRTLPLEMVARARKALLLGIFTFGVAGWFVVGRKGWGVFTGVMQVVCIPFSIFVFPFMFVLWGAGIYIPQRLVTQDAVAGALLDVMDESQRLRNRERLEEG